MKTIEEIRKRLNESGLLLFTTGTVRREEELLHKLTCDSREVISNTLFICKGAAFKKEYLQQASEKGCIVYISEKEWKVSGKMTGLIVRDIRKAMAVVSAAFYDYTPGRPILTGITGTKGKTTTAWYLKAMLDEWMKSKNQKETGLVSTLINYDGMKREDAVMTTPEAPVLHEMLANARAAQLPYMTMEVSSQALKYKRVRELKFQAGIFLNISEDHISPQEHSDFEDYFSAKLSIFRQSETACVNLDAAFSERILKSARKAGNIVTFGKDQAADFRYHSVKTTKDGKITFTVSCREFEEVFTLAMRGSFNIENALAAIAAASVYGVPVSCMKKALSETKVPGRMEQFFSRDKRICGIVDFAHNRLSFEKLFDTVYQEYSEYENVVTIFGCPGGKAYNRRKELGLIAGLYSDLVCITSDDPGMECPDDIAKEIREYVELTGCICCEIEDRSRAVETMVKRTLESGRKTLILLLGRGCEKYQKIGSRQVRCPEDARLMEQALHTDKSHSAAFPMLSVYKECF